MIQHRYLDSEHYRQMLVRDGERRFREWHGAFLKNQQEFLKQPTQTQQHLPEPPPKQL